MFWFFEAGSHLAQAGCAAKANLALPPKYWGDSRHSHGKILTIPILQMKKTEVWPGSVDKASSPALCSSCNLYPPGKQILWRGQK